MSLSSPVAITAGATYIASYYTSVGHYSISPQFFGAGAVSNPPLRAAADSSSSNGVFTYSASSIFPSSSFNATNYWVDVVFATSVAVPVVTGSFADRRQHPEYRPGPASRLHSTKL